MKHSQIRAMWFDDSQTCGRPIGIRRFASTLGVFLRWCFVVFAIITASAQAQAQVNNAAFVSQSVPASMTAGQTYSVSVRMRNTGTTTWTAANSYRLGSQNPQDNTIWTSTNRVALGVSVAPNQEYTFTFNVTAPVTAGTYNFQWQMVRDGVAWFGAASTNVAVSVATPVNNAAFVSQSVPTSMTAGQTYAVSVRMRNTGTTTWTAANSYRLGSQNPQDNTIWTSTNRVALGVSVAPNEEYTFTFNVTAPATAGTYNFQWMMVRDGVGWFGAASTNVPVSVTAQVNNAAFVSQSVPASMTAGQTYSVSVRMRNTGTTTWTAANSYRLGSQNPADNTIWTSTNRVALGVSVAPNEEYTFTFNITAPTTAGTYNFQWKMTQDGVGWFGAASTNVAVSVTAAQINNAAFVSQSVPASMTAGQAYSVSVRMRNTGTTTWTAANSYRLGSQNPADNTIWTSTNRVALGVSVAPNEEYTFTFNITAPPTAGTYNFQWKMTQDGVGWFGAASTNVAVAVSGPPAPPPVVISKTGTRVTQFVIDPVNGLLSKEIVEPGDTQLRLETTYVYDAWGNKAEVTVSSPATGTAAIAVRTSKTGYDARGQFPISSKNPLQHETITVVDPKFGGLVSVKDPNQLMTSWEYDSFGRKTLETRADGTKTRWEYFYCNGVNGGTTTCPSFAKYLIQTTPLAKNGAVNGPWSKVYYDALNREIKSETLGFDGTSIINKTTSYDNLGRIYQVSRPYYNGAQPQLSTTTYDVLGRVKEVQLPKLAVAPTRYTYSGLTSAVTNALGQKRTQIKNGLGQVVQITDASNNNLYYIYDAFGNLAQTKDAQNNVTTMYYDVRGRKTQMVDPDRGTWNYGYDVLDQLVTQRDAKLQDTTITYDVLGRMKTRAESGLSSTWTYDNCTNGIGKLCRATADNGYSNVISYDSVGRTNSTNTTIDAVYVTSNTYDSNTGRVGTQAYPNGLTLKYVYTPQGYLQEVRDNTSNALYWQANTRDAEDHLLGQTYGNGVVTQQVYEATTGYLKNICAGAGNGVQNLSFSYDDSGSLLSRNDANQNLSETFHYDALRRLDSSTVNSGVGIVTQTYGYDAIGNLKSRSDVGTYTYGFSSSRPHALNTITLTGGGKRTYSYDDNGNLTGEVQYDASNNVIASKGRTVTYTSFNMAKNLSSPNATIDLVYGPEHQRMKQIIAGGTTTIYLHPDNEGGLLYEKDVKADSSIEHRNFIVVENQAVAIVKQAGTSTAVTSVNYLHQDNLGSVAAITDQNGTVVERFAYEPFGKRRSPNGALDPNNSIKGVMTNRGYTTHEHLDALGLINMNGRMYDPAVGRFMSADPGVPYPMDMQSYNRYSYTRNNPLAFVDPSGFDDYKRDPNYDGYNPSNYWTTSSGSASSYNFWNTSSGRLGQTYDFNGGAYSYSGGALNSQQNMLGSRSVTGGAGNDAAENGSGGFAANNAGGLGPNGSRLADLIPGPDGNPVLTPKLSAPTFWDKVEKVGSELLRLAEGIPGEGVVVGGISKLVRTAGAADDVAKAATSFGQIKTVLTSAQEAYKGSTVVGHALSKHAGRHPEIWGKMTGSMKTWNDQAMTHFRDIVRGPGNFEQVTQNGISFLEKRLSDGRGMRLNMDGTFKGLID